MPRPRINVDPALLGHRMEIQIKNEKVIVSYIGNIAKVFIVRACKVYRGFAFSRESARKRLNSMLLQAEVFLINWRKEYDAKHREIEEVLREQKNAKRREAKKAANKKTQRKIKRRKKSA